MQEDQGNTSELWHGDVQNNKGSWQKIGKKTSENKSQSFPANHTLAGLNVKGTRNCLLIVKIIT